MKRLANRVCDVSSTSRNIPGLNHISDYPDSLPSCDWYRIPDPG